MIRTNAARGPQNTTGRKLALDDHWIYGRARPAVPAVRDHARRAGTSAHSPWRRVTTWCPACQPLSRRAPVDLDRARRLLALHPARREPTWPQARV